MGMEPQPGRKQTGQSIQKDSFTFIKKYFSIDLPE
jgi:hypothetical protein